MNVLDKFKEFHNLVLNKFGRNIQRIRCDLGTEYTNNMFKEYCKLKSIVREYTIGKTSSQNGKAERLNRIIVERARTILYQSGISTNYWNEAVAYLLFTLLIDVRL